MSKVEKDPKQFTCRYVGNELTLITDVTKPQALQALLNLIVREWHKANPTKLDKWYRRLTIEYELAKNKLNPKPAVPEEEVLDFNFWNHIMSLRPHEPYE